MKNKVVGSVVGCCLVGVGVGVSVGVRVSCCVWSRFHVTIINYHIVCVSFGHNQRVFTRHKIKTFIQMHRTKYKHRRQVDVNNTDYLIG